MRETALEKATTTRSPLIGKWRLVSMRLWDQAFVDLLEPGYIELKAGGDGAIAFGTVKVRLEWDVLEEGAVDFSFDGFDVLEFTSGEGSAMPAGNQIQGRVKFYKGHASGFSAERWVDGNGRRRDLAPGVELSSSAWEI